MVFNEWFGAHTDAQWRAYRRHNISPADHDGWVATGWDGDEIARWVCTGASVGVSVDGLFRPRWATAWVRAGFDAAAVSELVPAVTSMTGLAAHVVGPVDVAHVRLARQPSLFEQSEPMR